MVELSVIILNYNTKELLKQCLNSLLENHELRIRNQEYEVIVVDNGSTDNSVEMVKEFINKHSRQFASGTESLSRERKVRVPHIRENSRKPPIKLIENRANLGFAKGNNQGIKVAKGKYVLLLNSDTVVEKDTLSVMVKFMEENPKVGVATCRVELPDGKLDPACHRGFPTPWASLTYFLGLEKLFPKSKIFAQYHQTFKDLNTIHEIDSLTGAFYFVRHTVVNRVGLLDEDYFMYGEDLDWSYRIKQAGWKIMYLPDVKITHLKRQSGRENVSAEERKKATGYFYSTMKLFYQKHYQDKYPFFINWLMIWGINLKWWLAVNV